MNANALPSICSILGLRFSVEPDLVSVSLTIAEPSSAFGSPSDFVGSGESSAAEIWAERNHQVYVFGMRYRSVSCMAIESPERFVPHVVPIGLSKRGLRQDPVAVEVPSGRHIVCQVGLSFFVWIPANDCYP